MTGPNGDGTAATKKGIATPSYFMNIAMILTFLFAPAVALKKGDEGTGKAPKKRRRRKKKVAKTNVAGFGAAAQPNSPARMKTAAIFHKKVTFFSLWLISYLTLPPSQQSISISICIVSESSGTR